MNSFKNSLSLKFKEASDFYQHLASHAENLTMKHGLLKVVEVFAELRRISNALPNDNEAKVLTDTLSEQWNANYEQLQVGNPSDPQASLIDQRLCTEVKNLSLLKRELKQVQGTSTKRKLADIVANYFDAVEILKQFSTTQGVKNYG